MLSQFKNIIFQGQFSLVTYSDALITLALLKHNWLHYFELFLWVNLHGELSSSRSWRPLRWSRVFQHFINLEYVLPYSETSATVPNTEPVESSKLPPLPWVSNDLSIPVFYLIKFFRNTLKYYCLKFTRICQAVCSRETIQPKLFYAEWNTSCASKFST